MQEAEMGSDTSLSLDRQLCFALYSASRAFTNLYRPLLDEIGLTYPQYLVMLVLWERDPVSVKALGASLRLDSGTLSPLLKRLQTNGLLARQRNADDERSVEVTLTDAGRELRERARSIPEHMIAAADMEQDEAVALRSTLERLTLNMDVAAQRIRESAEAGSGTDDLLPPPQD